MKQIVGSTLKDLPDEKRYRGAGNCKWRLITFDDAFRGESAMRACMDCMTQRPGLELVI